MLGNISKKNKSYKHKSESAVTGVAMVNSSLMGVLEVSVSGDAALAK
jgi:hypothetical protein